MPSIMKPNRLAHRSLFAALLGLLLITSPAMAQADTAPKAPDAPGAEAGPKQVGWLRLDKSLLDAPPPVAGMIGQTIMKRTMSGVIGQLEHVAADDSYIGIVIHYDNAPISLTQIYALDAAIQKIRKSGKEVIVFAESYSVAPYLLACSADRILLQKKGHVFLHGLGAEQLYLAGLFEKIGMKADFIQIGDHKGAAEPLTNTKPSDEWNATMDRLLGDLYDQVIERISKARKMNRKQAEKAIEDSMTLDDRELQQRGLVDELVSRDLRSVTGKVFGNDFIWDTQMGMSNMAPEIDNPFALFRMLFEAPQAQVSRPSIAVVNLQGHIHSGESGVAGPFSSESIGSRTIVKALAETRDNDMIKAVVLRINSPGGSAIASEVIWQAVREVGEKKPVYVSIGNTAASGGYYIACAGHEIYIQPSSITGSIGVVGGKFVMGGLYEKIGINAHTWSKGPHGAMFSSSEPFTKEQHKVLEKSFEKVYEQFEGRVKLGRGKRIGDIDKVAHGRLFTGRQAVDNGLADQIGGLEQAIHGAREKANLKDGEYGIVNLPRAKPFAEMLEDLFGGEANAPALTVEQAAVLKLAQRTLGDQRWQTLKTQLNGLMLMKEERVLAISPSVLFISTGK